MFDRDLLVMKPQEVEGNYDYSGHIWMGREFFNTFGPDAGRIAGASVAKVLALPNPDYIHVFTYGDVKFYVTSLFEKGTKPSDYYGVEEFYVSVVLPSER